MYMQSTRRSMAVAVRTVHTTSAVSSTGRAAPSTISLDLERSQQEEVSNFLQLRHARSLLFHQLAPPIYAPINRMGRRQQYRLFSSEAAAAKVAETETTAAPQELTFSTPRVKDLYERMAKLKKGEVSLVGELILENLDLVVEPDEFYFYGIGKGGGGGKGAAAVEVVEEVKKDKFDLKLLGFDGKSKIKVIKEVRTLTGLGLKEAKELVESSPKTILKDLKTENAEELKEKLEAVGAQIELV